MSKKYKYKMKYSWSVTCNENGFTKDDIKSEDEGLCDAMLCFSIIYPKDGSYSQSMFGMDGRSKLPLDTIDVFRAWSMLGMHLSENPDLTGWQKQITEMHAELMRHAIKELREKMDN